MIAYVSEKKLRYYLYMLQKAVKEESTKLSDSVVFFDAQSFYLHYKKLVCENGESIETVLHHMKHCIPLALTQQSLDAFLENSERMGENKKYRFDAFLQSAKEDFLQLLAYTKDDSGAFLDICMMCESLRKKQELLDTK